VSRTTVGSAQDVVWTDDAPYLTCDRQWEVIGHGRGYILRLVQVPIIFEFLYVRRDRGELYGQLRVLTDLPGTRSYEGALGAPGTFNLTSPQARKARAVMLADLSRAPHIDWLRLLEEFSARVINAEADGDPAVWLHQVQPIAGSRHFDVDGLELTQCHANMLFGESDTLKSWMLLQVLSELSRRGVRTALLDWELDEDAHHDRLARLYGDHPPEVLYLQCRKPLTLELDRILRDFHRHEITFAGVDSVVPACGSANPNDADVANQLIGSLRQLDVGSLLVAHVPKSSADQKGAEKPFGSQFWFALCRSIWFVAQTNTDPVVTGFYHRKSSLSRHRPAFGLSWRFAEPDGAPITITRADLADVPDLADRQSARERMRDLLKTGPLTPAQVAERLDIKPETIRKTIQRFPKLFGKHVSADGETRLALVERRYGS
jgi:hypothetical protein